MSSTAMSTAVWRVSRCTRTLPCFAGHPMRSVSILPGPLSQNQARWGSQKRDLAGNESRLWGKRVQRAPTLLRKKDMQREIRMLERKILELQEPPSIQEEIEDPLPILRGAPKGAALLTPGVVYLNDDSVMIGSKKLPNFWLRDNCQCALCMHRTTKQRLLDTFSISKDIRVQKATIAKKILSIDWSDGHKSDYETSLLDVRSNSSRSPTLLAAAPPLVLWDADSFSPSSPSSSPPPTVPYDPSPNSSVLPILRNIRTHGFCYIDNTPHDTPAATEALLRRIAFIRETHYGTVYDFTADLASNDTAYTNMALPAHTDTTYFSDPAGLQAFHLLEHTGGEGGASLLVDGFAVAAALWRLDRHAYQLLATVPVYAHASGNEDVSIQAYRGFPVLEHDAATGHLLRVRWNNADRVGVGLPVDKVMRWYQAAREWDQLVRSMELEYWEQLKPGRLLIFDNWRVLHGRSAFTGKRRVCGGYINRDDWISKYNLLQFGRDKVLKNLAAWQMVE